MDSGDNMPKKKEIISDAERAARINRAAYQAEVDNDPASFERAFSAVARGGQKPKKVTVKTGSGR